jgi:transposase-like protein
MSPTLASIVLYLIDAAKKNQTGPVICCWCNNRVNIIKYGKYQRYAFTGEDLIDIQRYLCKHDQCRRTFSILPHPFLRITRFSLCMFDELLRLVEAGLRIAEISRRFAVSWPTIARAVEMARRIVSFIRQEAKTQPAWAPYPCIHPFRCWSEFIRMFAAKFYPERYA